MTAWRALEQGDADGFRAPRPGGMELPEAARVIADLYGSALGLLASEVATAWELPVAAPPLAWLRRDSVPQCASCHTDVVVLPVVDRLRCPDCGAVTSLPEWWSR